ncbi:MAG TPA: discoidin domain-containing protein, partial [Tepidisphaeraceae bacterium]|nr:discoidin domain-containing protein [Tepidisphaeraceae bacterium]
MLGTPGSFNGLGDTLAKAFDGDVKTFFDAPTPDAWLGRDLGRPRAIAGFRFHPRAGHEGRMLGGRFEVADNPAFANATITGRIAVTPEAARWSSLSLSIPLTGQYWRYVAPPGGYGNVAEVEVLFAQPPPAVPTPQTQPVPPPPSTPPVDPVRAAAVDFDVTYTGPCNVRVAAKLGDDHKAWRLDWTFDGTPVTDGGKWAGYAWDEPGKPRVVTLVATDPQGVRRATTTRTVQTTPVALSEIRLPGGVPLPASVPANTRLLLPRGQTYTVATGKPLSLGANAMVGAYGDGAAPLLRYGDRLFNLSDNTVVADVAIVGLDNGSRVNDIKARGASFVRVEIRGGAGSFIENTAPSAPGLTMVGVVQTAPLKRGTVGIPGDDFVAVYCQLGPSWPEARPDQDEHENVARASRTTGHPPVARPLITGCLVKQSTPPNSKGCIDLREAIDATVTNNEATGGGIRFGQGNANAECASRGALIRGNRSATNGIGIKQGAQDVVVAGNAMAVTVDGAVQADGRAVTADVLIVSDRDVRVTGNPADPKQLRNVRVAAPKVTAVYEVAPKQWRTDDVTTALRPSTPPVVVTPPVPAKPATSAYRLKSRIGVNTNGSSLADLIKSRSGFGPIGQPWKTDAALQPKKDENGWPLEDASIQLVWNQHGFTGDYVLTFTGKATVDGFWNVDVTNMAHDPATNRSRANVRLRPKHATAPGDLAESYLNFRNTSGGVRDVVLVRKEHEGQYLNPDWVKLHAPFGVLRSMDLQLTNVSTWVTSWAARPKVSQACYGATGYPLEVLVDIANATG